MKTKNVTKESILKEMNRCNHPLIKDESFKKETENMTDEEFKQFMIEMNRKYLMKVDVYDGSCFYN